MLSTFFSTILKANVCLGETDAGRGAGGERGGGSGGISERVLERRGGSRIMGAEDGSFGICGVKRLGVNRLGDTSGVLGGNISGGKLAHGEPRDPRRSFKPIVGGGDSGGSSSAAATTTTGSALVNDNFGSLSNAIDLLK